VFQNNTRFVVNMNRNSFQVEIQKFESKTEENNKISDTIRISKMCLEQ